MVVKKPPGIVKVLDFLWYCFKLGLVVALMGWIVTKTYLNGVKQVVSNNWTQYRYSPMVMPFASHFGRDTGQNAMGYLFTSFKGSFGFLMKPLQYIMKIIHETMAKHHESMNLFRAILKPIRIFFMTATKQFYDVINHFTGMSVYLFAKIRDTLRRMGSTFQLSLYSLQAIQMTIQSIWDGPIGEVSRDWAYALDAISSFFCLAPSTLVKMVDGSARRVDQLQVGDRVSDGDSSATITGMVKTDGHRVPLYRYQGEYLSGSHLVYYRHQWTRVKDCPTAKVCSVTQRPAVLYCPMTTTHRLTLASGITVADFEETADGDINKFNTQLSLNYLNRSNTPITLLPSLDQPGFSEGSLVCLADGQFKPIQDIVIGERLRRGQVLGTAMFMSDDHLVSLSTVDSCTRRQIIRHITNHTHTQPWHLADSVNLPISSQTTMCYSLITTTGIYQVGEYLATDILDGLPSTKLNALEQKITDSLNRGRRST